MCGVLYLFTLDFVHCMWNDLPALCPHHQIASADGRDNGRERKQNNHLCRDQETLWWFDTPHEARWVSQILDFWLYAAFFPLVRCPLDCTSLASTWQQSKHTNAWGLQGVQFPLSDGLLCAFMGTRVSLKETGCSQVGWLRIQLMGLWPLYYRTNGMTPLKTYIIAMICVHLK